MTVKRVGVIGGGQLAWMMAKAAQRLGFDLIIQTPQKDDPAVSIATEVIFAHINDRAATIELAARCDVITFENEFIDLEVLKPLEEKGVYFCPSLGVLTPLLDKYQQKSYLQRIGLPVPKFTTLENLSSIDFSFPIVLKVRRHGYDGQGTFIVKTSEELETTAKNLEGTGVMVEEFVPFERELAVMAARSVTGEVAVYPLVETYQPDQVCRWVLVSGDISTEIQTEVKQIAINLLTQLEVVGIFGIELFLTPQSQVLVNEIAPRTHNSGHYTIDACEISQFEMQLRALSGLPLGSTELNCVGAVMVNLLGYEYSRQDYLEKRQKLSKISNSYVHWYGKINVRPGRKIGHVTVLLEETEMTLSPKTQQQQLLEIAQQVESIWYGS
ncbi:5-(carboxyamino)imidazole ribonucleotide synthase [cyanobacterium endosymbiont of Rhopalodia gibberula]|uniref:5-(carboxyamino)imidazole ribonucleotide synthase n=1 Tax=cyanobacterium endosymbiont of Rhopalodia gibberula TaxID=1763363 RepID=UPI000E64C607|nr:5-(carboxyamino)imidazole ribonucleotide synthase [cyanobacterium endosymbiont of Rhopalodia gibberula]